ncbi:hypothetical protein DYH09_12375 [bacterium CPR1]|nr:hypothetical protein [bacterium CPR1]
MVSQIIQRNGALESPAQLAYRHEAKAQLADQAGQPTSPCASGALPLCQGRVCPESTGMIQPMAVLGFFFGMLATLAEGLLVYHGLPALARAFPVGDGIASVVAIFFLTFLVGLVVSRWPHFGPGRSLQAASWDAGGLCGADRAGMLGHPERSGRGHESATLDDGRGPPDGPVRSLVRL